MDGSPISPLVAIWIDPAMRAFERKLPATAQTDSVEINSDEPDGSALRFLTAQAAIRLEQDCF
jgi:hypothetical protein